MRTPSLAKSLTIISLLLPILVSQFAQLSHAEDLQTPRDLDLLVSNATDESFEGAQDSPEQEGFPEQKDYPAPTPEESPTQEETSEDQSLQSSSSPKETVEVTRASGERDNILITGFNYVQDEALYYSNLISDSLETKFQNLEDIRVLDSQEILPKVYIPLEITNFDALQEVDVNYIVNGVIEHNAKSNIIDLTVSVWDTLLRGRIMLKTYSFNQKFLSMVQKVIATDIYGEISGEFGFFYGKLMYLSKSKKDEFSRIAVNQETDTVRFFTRGNKMIMAPRYCYNRDALLFSMQDKYFTHLYYAENIGNEDSWFRSIKKIKLGARFENISVFSPDISRDCTDIVFSASRDGSTNLFLFRGKTGKVVQLTNIDGIATSPRFIDGGRKGIIYTYDGVGTSKIYLMNKDGSNKRVIDTGIGTHLSPSASYNGELISYIKIKNGMFHLMASNIDGSDARSLYSSFLIENPIWTSTGYNIIFSAKSGVYHRSKVYTVSAINGKVEEIEASGDASEPMWIGTM